MAYDSSKPVTGGALIAADIRENFRALKEDKIVDAASVIDKVPTATPTANAIPVADANGKLDSWVSQSITGSLTTNGYEKFPNGLIIQWGTSPSISVDSSATITFPIAFPNAALSAQATDLGSGESTSVGIKELTTTDITLYVPSSDTGSRTYYWLAIGY